MIWKGRFKDLWHVAKNREVAIATKRSCKGDVEWVERDGPVRLPHFGGGGRLPALDEAKRAVKMRRMSVGGYEWMPRRQRGPP